MFASKVGVLLKKAQRDFTHVGYSFACKCLTRVEATTVKSATAILIMTIYDHGEVLKQHVIFFVTYKSAQ